MDDERGVSLTRVLSAYDQDYWLVIVFALLVLVSDLEYRDVHATIGCSHRFLSNELVI